MCLCVCNSLNPWKCATKTNFQTIVSVLPLRGKTFDGLEVALRRLGFLFDSDHLGVRAFGSVPEMVFVVQKSHPLVVGIGGCPAITTGERSEPMSLLNLTYGR